MLPRSEPPGLRNGSTIFYQAIILIIINVEYSHVYSIKIKCLYFVDISTIPPRILSLYIRP